MAERTRLQQVEIPLTMHCKTSCWSSLSRQCYQFAYMATDFITRIYQLARLFTAAFWPADAVTSDASNMTVTSREMSPDAAELIRSRTNSGRSSPDLLGKTSLYQYVSRNLPNVPKQKKRRLNRLLVIVQHPENTTYPEIIDWLNPVRLVVGLPRIYQTHISARLDL